MTIGKRIAQFLKDNGIVQSKLAERIGLNNKTLNAKLNGRNRLFADEIEKICLDLKVSPEEFIKH